MHWRHIKWRAPWQKRHLSVLEKFLVEDSARKKAAEKERQDAEIARVCLQILRWSRRLICDSGPHLQDWSTKEESGNSSIISYVAF